MTRAAAGGRAASLAVAAEVALGLAREALRALLVPMHLALYLPRRRALQRRAVAALRDRGQRPGAALQAFLAAHPPLARQDPHVFLSAGEPSGEAHAVKLMHAVTAGGGAVRWTCFGGPAMAAAGGRLAYALAAHPIMGISAALATLPFAARAFARFVRLLRDDRPDLVVLVDYPGLHLVMAAAARRRGIPVIHYIAPQYWAWGPWRMRRYRACVDACLTILPFEPGLFWSAGVPAEYVGHPLLDEAGAQASARPSAAGARLLCLLPGSRRREIELHLPPMLAVARELRARDPDLRVSVAHRDPARAEFIRGLIEREGAQREVEFTPGALRERLAAARVVIAKSGTGALEAALLDAPTVVVYTVRGRATAELYRALLMTPYFAVANLIAGAEVLPEVGIRRAGDWQVVRERAAALLADGPARQACLAGITEVRRRLGAPGASARVARWILAYCGRAAVAQRTPG
jgi:lipid-A-disaccharide synthase